MLMVPIKTVYSILTKNQKINETSGNLELNRNLTERKSTYSHINLIIQIQIVILSGKIPNREMNNPQFVR